MKITAMAVVAAFLAATVSGPALAGQPTNPGGDSAKEAVAAAKESGSTLGQVNQAADPNGPNFGQDRKYSDSGDARPDASHDKGKGNDW
jgi:hypothetical protein